MILKNMSFALLLCGGLLLMGSAAQAESVKTPVNKISPDGVGEEIGFITFSDADGGGVDIIVDLTGLPEGEHGMHVHENASCAPAEKDGNGGGPGRWRALRPHEDQQARRARQGRP